MKVVVYYNRIARFSMEILDCSRTFQYSISVVITNTALMEDRYSNRAVRKEMV